MTERKTIAAAGEPLRHYADAAVYDRILEWTAAAGVRAQL
jgi:hypothetical protein